MNMCEVCTAAVKNVLNDNSLRRTVKAQFPPYPQTLQSGCWICDRLVSWVESNHQEIFKKWHRSPANAEFDMSSMFGFCGSTQRDQPLLPCDVAIAPEGVQEGCQIRLGFACRQDLSPYLFAGLPDHDPITRALGFIRPWIDRCSKAHLRCRQANSVSWLPTRLVHLVQGEQGIVAKLTITKDITVKERYMTLSHRWPAHPDRHAMLKSSTLAQFQRGIDVQQLPRSFQETMELACHLHIEYLWIDSLCIRQDEDDLSDWEKEAVTMHKVYAHSFLNVSATFSCDGTESLFSRPPTWAASPPPQFEVNVNGELREAYVVDGDLWNRDVTDAPLNKRGWVFQERFLACRVLRFGRTQLGWECCEAEALEMFPNGVPTPLVVGSNSKSSMMEVLSESSCSDLLNQESDLSLGDATTKTLPSENEIKFIEWRCRLIEEYSKCQLTYAKDKLIAFLGVAKSEVLLKRPSDQYVAGMWKSSLVYDLAWQRIYNEIPLPTTLKHSNSRAPSWSWASFDGEVIFPAIPPDFEPSLFSGNVDLSGGPLENGTRASTGQGSILGSEGCIHMECFLFTLSLLWSTDGDVAGIKLNMLNITFINEGTDLEDHHQEAIDDPFGIFTDLNDNLLVPEGQSLRRLAQVGNLFFVPLFATAHSLHAMAVTRLGQGGIYLRVGGIEVVLQARAEVPTPDMTTQDAEKLRWDENRSARRLRLYMEKSPKQLGETDDYRHIRIV